MLPVTNFRMRIRTFLKQSRRNSNQIAGKRQLLNFLYDITFVNFSGSFYMTDISKAILPTQENGMQLQIGPFENPNSFQIHAFIHLCMITGDHAQLEFLCGTSFRNKNKKCRICMSNNIHSLNIDEAIGPFRDDISMQNMDEAKSDVTQKAKFA